MLVFCFFLYLTFESQHFWRFIQPVTTKLLDWFLHAVPLGLYSQFLFNSSHQRDDFQLLTYGICSPWPIYQPLFHTLQGFPLRVQVPCSREFQLNFFMSNPLSSHILGHAIWILISCPKFWQYFLDLHLREHNLIYATLEYLCKS